MADSDRSAFDAHMMAVALAMARRGLGLTAPNPSVGCVVANEMSGEIIARAATARGGRPHAETIALAEAGARARGATLYVTLEPCSHTGQTGPCADQIVASGITRVVAAIEDPDPRVAGRGLEKLRTADIDVQRGLCQAEARWLTRGHIVRVTERRPFVTLKLALNFAGEVPRGHGGVARIVTGQEANARGHLLRAQNDAILVGSGTVRDDDPRLTCRLPGLQSRSPVRVVLSRNLEISPDAKLILTAGDVPVWLMCSATLAQTGHNRFHSSSVEMIGVAQVGGRLWLPDVLEKLVARGITRLLVEGGPLTWRAFADNGIVDDVSLFIAGHARQNSEQEARAFLKNILGETAFALKGTDVLGADRLWRFSCQNSREGT